MERLPLQRRMKRWPLALSGTEVGQMLGMIREDSYRVMVMAMDSTELRSRESVHLRAEDLERVSEHRAEEPVRVLDVDLAVAVGQSLPESLGRSPVHSTRCGGSVSTSAAALPFLTRCTSAMCVLSPQSRRWLPRIHRSPGLATETAGGGSAPESLFLTCTRS